jgi:predicted RNA binding protein YcfA (HicA-like mRNA interferase family)
MTRLPQVPGDQVVKALQKLGFLAHTGRGSHVTVRHPLDLTRRSTVPCHKGKPLGKGLLHSILRDVQVTADELRECL